MFRIIRSRAGAILLTLIVGVLVFGYGLLNSAERAYREVATLKYTTANNVWSIAEHYPSVNTETMQNAYRKLFQLENLRSEIDWEYKLTVGELDREFISAYNDLMLERLTKKDRADLEWNLNRYVNSTNQLTPVAKLVLQVNTLKLSEIPVITEIDTASE